MWLKATALGLGAQLLSGVHDAQDNPKLSEFLGLAKGEFSFDACVIGFPTESFSDVAREEPHLDIKWIDQ
jgi:nitroreductase